MARDIVRSSVETDIYTRKITTSYISAIDHDGFKPREQLLVPSSHEIAELTISVRSKKLGFNGT